jgi:phage/plasmid-associated DNA primase
LDGGEVTDEPTPFYVRPDYDKDGNFKRYLLDNVAYSNFLKEHFHVVYFRKTIYIYDDSMNVYRVAQNEIQTHIRDTFVKYTIGGTLGGLQKELLTHLESMGCYIKFPFNRGTDDIPIDNGVVRIAYDTGVVALLPHGAEHMFTFKLPVRYEPSVPTTLVTDIFSQWVEPENVVRLLQIPSQSFLQMQTGIAYKKAHLLQGIGNNGKSGFVRLNRMFFGVENTTSVSLHQICDSRFALSEMEGSLLNIFDELRDVALDTIENFKIITGDCNLRIEAKYKQGYTAYVPAANVFTCNAAPSYPKKVQRDSAFWERWEYIKFPNVFAVNPTFYEETFTDEFMSSYLNAIIATMIHMKRTGDLLIRSDVQTVMGLWNANGDPLYQFIQWGFTVTNGKITNRYSKVKLHQAYLQWCKDNNVPEHRRMFTLTKFTQAIQYQGFIAVQREEKSVRYEVYETSDWELNRGVISELSYHNDTPVMDIPISNAQTLGV